MVDTPSDKKLLNPYRHVTAIRTPHEFFGRVQFLESIYSLIDARQNVAITGLRRIGKSSVLACMGIPEFQRRFTDRDLSHHIFIHVDLGEHQQKTTEGFLNFVSKQLVQQTQDKLVLEVPESSGVDEFRDLLDEIKAQGFHPVLLLDELDSITRNPRFDPNFFTFLRAQADHGKISYVTASLTSLEKLSHPGLMGSPFFNIFAFRTLGVFTKDEAWHLIAEPSSTAGCSFLSSEIEWALGLAGRHPFFIQCVCYFLFEEKTQSDATRLNYERVELQAYNQLKPHFDYAWKHLEVEEQEILKREARRKDHDHREIPELSESSLFRKFLRDKYGITQESPEITSKYLEQILSKLNNLKYLGESKLSYLNVVYARSPMKASAHERGAIVQRLLISLAEGLKPTSSEKETSAGRLCAILNYCYFDKGLANAQIAAHLSISERQFYRDRKQAIQDLLNRLLELEASPEKWSEV
jgi:hypothetical protein